MKDENTEDEEMICALTLDERGALRRGLRELPEALPPRAVWNRIRAQAEAEGLIAAPRLRRPSTWYAGGGLAAAALLAAVILPFSLRAPGPGSYVTPGPETRVTNGNSLSALQALMVESRDLERDLRALPEEPRVVRAGTQAMILDLEDRIASIDYQLSDPDARMSPEDREIFWRERVRLMKSLVRLRYAQAQRTAF